jgi:ribosomal protein L37E
MEINSAEEYLKTCPHCDEIADRAWKYCACCGYPTRMKIEEQSQFLTTRERLHNQYRFVLKNNAISQNLLYIICASLLFSSYLIYLFERSGGLFWHFCVFGLTYGWLGWLAGKKPVPALITGLVFFISYQLVTWFLEPGSIKEYIYFKTAIVVSMLLCSLYEYFRVKTIYIFCQANAIRGYTKQL